MIVRSILFKRTLNSYRKSLVTCAKDNNIILRHTNGEDEWMKKWSGFAIPVNPNYFRLYSYYMNDIQSCIPEDIFEYCCSPMLNPVHLSGYFSDKNLFDKILPSGYCAKTFFRCMNGQLMDSNYTPLKLYNEEILSFIPNDAIIVKPTVGSCGGAGVNLFHKKGDCYVNIETGNILNLEWLSKNYNGNYIVQEVLAEHESLSKFNSTSVNTIRAVIYRSVVTNEIHFINAVLRFGAAGKHVDNGHAGGHFIAINKEGKLGNYALDSTGRKYSYDNNIDFTQEHTIPNWNRIVDFAKSVASYVPYHHVIALDLMLDTHGEPKIIEYNIGGFSSWLFQFAGLSCFDRFTDEIIEYCKSFNIQIPPQMI